VHATTTASAIAVVRVVSVTSAAASTSTSTVPTTAIARCHPDTHTWKTPMNSSTHSSGRTCRHASDAGNRATA